MARSYYKDADAPGSLLALDLGYITEDKFAELGGVTLNTLESWRKNHRGPEWVRLGNAVLYPLAGVQLYLAANTRSNSVSGVL